MIPDGFNDHRIGSVMSIEKHRKTEVGEKK